MAGDHAQELAEAIVNGNKETSIRLLESAGGPCAVRDLVESSKMHGYDVDYTLGVDKISDSETLSLYITSSLYRSPYKPVVSITQPRCKR